MIITAMAHLGRGRRPRRAQHACSARPATTRPTWSSAASASPGIAIALLGRNNPVGIAFRPPLLWAFMDVLQHPARPGRAAQGDRRRSCRRSSCCRSSSPTRSIRRLVGPAQQAQEIGGRPAPPRWRRRRAPLLPDGPGRPGRTPQPDAGLWTRIRALPGRGHLDRLRARLRVRHVRWPSEISGADPLTGSSTFRSALQLADADRAGRPRRPLVGAGRRRQHRPRRDDDPRHLVRRLGGDRVRAVAGRAARHPRRRRSAASSTPSPPSPSASTTSSPASRSTSSATGVAQFLTNIAFEGSNKSSPSIPEVVQHVRRARS